jgi:hypothetical protein
MAGAFYIHMLRRISLIAAALFVLSPSARAQAPLVQAALRPEQLPSPYRALFELRRVFFYQLQYKAEDDEGASVVHEALATCRVADVSAKGEALRSRIVCKGLPAEDAIDGFPLSARGLVDGVWVARSSGLWREQEGEGLGASEPTRPLLDAQPKPSKLETTAPDEASGNLLQVKRGGSSWCVLEAEWSDHQSGVKRCFAPEGIRSAQSQDSGGTFFEATLKLLTPRAYRRLLRAQQEVPPNGKDFSEVRYDDYEALLPTHGNTIAAVLKKRGVAPPKIVRVQYVMESRCAADTDPESLSFLWERVLEPAEPYKFWLPSGYGMVEIYVAGQSEPAAYLAVNETDSTTTAGSDLRYMCHGLYATILEITRGRDNFQKVPAEVARLLKCPVDAVEYEQEEATDRQRTHKPWRLKATGCGTSASVVCEPLCSAAFSCKREETGSGKRAL